MKIAVIGTGFVGVVSASVYASFGHTVVGLDIDQAKVDSLNAGSVPFYEPNLEELLQSQLEKGDLTFTTSYQEAITDADVIIIGVGTPSKPSGEANLDYVFAAAESTVPYLKSGVILAVKSTVPPGTLDKVQEKLEAKGAQDFDLASLPEFLREGSAVHDTLHADRVVIGATKPETIETLKKLHKPIDAPVIVVNPNSAQMGKYTANAYLATRITFINQIANLCEKNGADINEVIEVIGHDQRIGKHYWYPGLGYGGSCFPKDVDELAAYARSVEENDNLLITVSQLNKTRINAMMQQFETEIGGWENKSIAILGLAFKPNTSDMREAPSIGVVEYLSQKNIDSTITAYDPEAIEEAQKIFASSSLNITYTESVEEAVSKTDVVLALIEWPEVTSFDFSSVTTESEKQKYFIDARNQFEAEEIKKAGYSYIGIGKGNA